MNGERRSRACECALNGANYRPSYSPKLACFQRCVLKPEPAVPVELRPPCQMGGYTALVFWVTIREATQGGAQRHVKLTEIRVRIVL